MVYSIADVSLKPGFFTAEEHTVPNPTSALSKSALASLGQALVFSDLERSVLKMRFKDGMSVSAIARAMQLKPYDVTVLETTCLKRIRTAAIAVGLDFESLLRQLK